MNKLDSVEKFFIALMLFSNGEEKKSLPSIIGGWNVVGKYQWRKDAQAKKGGVGWEVMSTH